MSENIKNCVGKKIVYFLKQNTELNWHCPLNEGVVECIKNDIVKISGSWYEIKDVVIKTVLNDNLYESGTNGDMLING